MKNKIKYFSASFIQFSGIILLSILFERIIEVLIIIPLFFWFRSKYIKTYHSKTIWQCTLYTLIMFLIICLIAQPIYISIIITIILCFVTTELLFYIQDYLDFLKVKEFKIYKGMNKEMLLNKCKMYDLTDVETKVLTMYYCDKLKRWQIGNVLGYSEDNISKIKEKALNKFKKKESSIN